MNTLSSDKPALLIIDMVKDNLDESGPAPTETIHKQTLDIYRKNVLYPLFKIRPPEQLLAGLRQQGAESKRTGVRQP